MNWSALWYAAEWIVRIVMLGVVTHRRKPSAAMAWLVIVFFLPVPGAVLYLLLGRDRLPRRRARKHARRVESIRRLADGVARKQHAKPHDELSPFGAVAPLAERLGRMPVVGGNAVELVEDTAPAIDRLIDDIDAARHHVHMLFYIWADDDTGRRVTEALARAVDRGVTCRVLLDSAGSWPMFYRGGSQRLREAGVDLREALPVGGLRRKFARLDLRNHRKIVVIDGRLAWTGSQNIINPDYGTKDLEYSDLMARIEGPAVHEIQWTFAGDWYAETDEVLDSDAYFPEPDTPGSVPIQTLPSGPSDPVENYPRLIVTAIQAARRRVIINTPYFVPDEPTMAAMESAAMRGVRVDLVVPRRTDHPLVDAASRAYYEPLFEAGVRIFSHREGMLHTKAMSVDEGLALVGSGNFDIRSFKLNFELNLLFFDSDVPSRLRAIQETYIEESVELSLDKWRDRPAWHIVGQDVAKLLSPLL